MGSSYYDWLFVKWLWVAGTYRGQRIGSRLLKAAEEVARERNVGAVYLDTFAFQALELIRQRSLLGCAGEQRSDLARFA